VTIRTVALLAFVALLPACADGRRPAEPYCETLAALRRGDVPLPDSENELVGHVASLDALLARQL